MTEQAHKYLNQLSIEVDLVRLWVKRHTHTHTKTFRGEGSEMPGFRGIMATPLLANMLCPNHKGPLLWLQLNVSTVMLSYGWGYV